MRCVDSSVLCRTAVTLTARFFQSPSQHLRAEACGTRFGDFGDGKWGRRRPPALHLVAHEAAAHCRESKPSVRMRNSRGEVTERLKVLASKASVRETVPWVRIPPSPPEFPPCLLSVRAHAFGVSSGVPLSRRESQRILRPDPFNIRAYSPRVG